MGTAASQTSRKEALSLTDEVTEWDQQAYRHLISLDLTEEQRHRIVEPAEVYDRQEAVIAVHWHPEFIPMDLIHRRIGATFPNRRYEMIIPTQHNELTSYGGFSGVEVDCFSRDFNRKVQLLCHFAREKLDQADVFRSMLDHTFKYRSRQLFEFIDSIIDPTYEDRVQAAAEKTGADDELIRFVRVHTKKLRDLFSENEAITPPAMVKNKLLTHYFDSLREHFDQRLVNHAQMFLKAVKKIVKANFRLEFFYQTEEVIEEVRSLDGGIVIPHPEQFWPILLAEYDVDGYEVWNPQSREFTEFLIQVVHRHNKSHRHGRREILIFMGDDCHMGEKARDPAYQIPEKAGREIGVQPAWDDVKIRKSLIIANASRRRTIEEYRARLA